MIICDAVCVNRPGTGKTVTIVEAIRQLLNRDPNTRILACAPSNSAADLIAEKLSVIGRANLFRLNALSRNYDENFPRQLEPFSLLNGNLVFAIPEVETLRSYRVVVSTCISGGIPSALGIKRGHFNHIFIDEAGQATEPEIMVMWILSVEVTEYELNTLIIGSHQIVS